MARVHFWQYIVDTEGRPLEDVNIRFYLNDNPSEEAELFTHPSIGSPVTSSEGALTTNGNGYFEFWVGDEFESLGGYVSTQKFRLTWERAGILLGQINNIDVFPPVFQVDETDTTSALRDQKNKLVSNSLANLWSTHADADAPATLSHNYLAVDTASTNGDYNKLVSNALMNYILSAVASAGTLSIAASAAVERDFYITAWSSDATGYYVDLSHFIGRQYPVLQIVDDATDGVIEPLKITATDENTVRLYVSEEIDAHVTVIG